MVSHERHDGVGVGHGVKELFNGSNHLANVLVAEAALADELEDEGEAALLGKTLVNGEVHVKVIPGGMSAAVLGYEGFGFLLFLGVAVEDGDDGVYGHLGKEVDIFEVFG